MQNFSVLTQCPLKKKIKKLFFLNVLTKGMLTLQLSNVGATHTFQWLQLNTTQNILRDYFSEFQSGSIITTQRNCIFSLPCSLCYNMEIVFHPYFRLNEFLILPKINPLPSTHEHSPLRRIRRRKTKTCAQTSKEICKSSGGIKMVITSPPICDKTEYNKTHLELF